MIGLKNFGWRLGNQMFQIAALIGTCDMHGEEPAFPQWDYAKYFAGDFTPVDFVPTSIYTQPNFHYESVPYSRDMALDGYFQSEKFFERSAKKIRRMFTLKKSILDEATDLKNQLLGCKTSNRLTAIHVRRGDYLKYPDHHPQQDHDYYQKAISEFPSQYNERGQNFIVFSDDIEWCKSYSPFNTFIFCNEPSDIKSFALMTLCDDFIITNSSFSWWAAWLGSTQDKKVITPKKWFGPAYANWNTKDLYCKDWIKL